MICQADFMLHEICVAIIFSYHLKNRNITNIMATENFMFNKKSATHTRIVEYETAYILPMLSNTLALAHTERTALIYVIVNIIVYC
jgi:hypothetical protein